MNIKMDKLDIYNDSAIILERKTSKKIISWITILIILLILFIIFSLVPFNIYKTYIGYINIEGNDTYFTTKLDISDFPILNNKTLYIEDKKYSYEVINIDEDLVLKINLDKEYKIDNNYITANILSKRTTLFKIIKEKIKKGFGL